MCIRDSNKIIFVFYVYSCDYNVYNARTKVSKSSYTAFTMKKKKTAVAAKSEKTIF